ncbi:MAG: hypothetical protein V1901_04120 [Patescibacteria group bacterium]
MNILDNLKLFLYGIGYRKKCLCGGKIMTIKIGFYFSAYEPDSYKIKCSKCGFLYSED